MSMVSRPEFPEGIGDISDLLWRDTSIISHRYRKSAASLAAVATVLENQKAHNDAETEFLEAYGQLGDIPGEVLFRLWNDPYVYYWVRVAYELTHATVNQTQPAPLARHVCQHYGARGAREGLGRHLLDFGRLLLGAAIVDGTNLRLASPLRVAAPFAIPATRLTVVGDGDMEIAGIRNDELEIRAAGGESRTIPTRAAAAEISDSLTLQRCPEATYEDCVIRLQPPVLNIPINNVSRAVCRATLESQELHRQKVVEALEAMHTVWPALFSQFSETMSVVILAEPMEANQAPNISHSDLPGLAAVCPLHRPLDLANVLIHEYHHSRLFFIEELGALLDEELPSAPRYYSPWRNDPRPSHGLLHATYVFTAVCRHWLKVFELTDDEATRKVAQARALRAELQLRMGLDQLDRHAHFTPFGRQVWDQLSKDSVSLRVTMERLGLPEDMIYVSFDPRDGTLCTKRNPETSAAQTVRGELLAHLRQFAKPEEVSRLLSIA
jgi:HEXXH motif-containing protein